MAEEATLQNKKLAQTQTASEEETHKDTPSSAENTEPVVVITVPMMLLMKFSEMEPSKTEEEEVVMIFGEHFSE